MRKEPSPVHIRWMIRRDMPEVLAIEKKSFEFPWSEDDFLRCLRQRNCIGMVAEIDGKVAGFIIYELHKNRLHILNFAIDPEFRRRGIGSAMVQKLLSKLSHQRRNQILLEVRETNLPAQLFFKKHNFRAISTLKDFYEDTTEDAYLMNYQVPSKEEVLHIIKEELKNITHCDWDYYKEVNGLHGYSGLALISNQPFKHAGLVRNKLSELYNSYSPTQYFNVVHENKVVTSSNNTDTQGYVALSLGNYLDVYLAIMKRRSFNLQQQAESDIFELATPTNQCSINSILRPRWWKLGGESRTA